MSKATYTLSDSFSLSWTSSVCFERNRILCPSAAENSEMNWHLVEFFLFIRRLRRRIPTSSWSRHLRRLNFHQRLGTIVSWHSVTRSSVTRSSCRRSSDGGDGLDCRGCFKCMSTTDVVWWWSWMSWCFKCMSTVDVILCMLLVNFNINKSEFNKWIFKEILITTLMFTWESLVRQRIKKFQSNIDYSR